MSSIRNLNISLSIRISFPRLVAIKLVGNFSSIVYHLSNGLEIYCPFSILIVKSQC